MLPVALLATSALARSKVTTNNQRQNTPSRIQSSSLAASSLARPGINYPQRFGAQNPTYQGAQTDSGINFTIPRPPPRSNGTWGTYYNTTNQSLFLTKLSDDRVVIVSTQLKGAQSTAILRISNTPHLRLGVEWARNQSFINGDKDKRGKRYGADLTHAVRFIGMIEVNDTVKTFFPNAASYFFNNMTWSPFTVMTTTAGGGARMINLNTSALSNGLTFNFAIHISDTPNVTLGVSPFAIKYDFNVTGIPVYKLQNSHYRLINLVHNSNQNYDSFNSTALGYGATAYSWVNNVTVDGTPSTLLSTTLLNQTTTDDTRWFSVSKGTDHESSLDSYSSKVILGFEIPKFMSSFYWDPTVSVDSTMAAEEYTASGGQRVGAWMGLVGTAIAMGLL